MSQQRRLVAVSSMVVFGTVYLAGVKNGDELPTARFLIGFGIAFTIVSIMVDLGSPMGAGFAVLIMVSAVLTKGEDALSLLFQRSRGAQVSAGNARAERGKRTPAQRGKGGKLTGESAGFSGGGGGGSSGHGKNASGGGGSW